MVDEKRHNRLPELLMKKDYAIMRMLSIWILCMGASHSARSQTVIFVDQSAAGSGDGSGWSNAFVSLQDALAKSRADDEIWVATGTYKPDLGDGITLGDRKASFSPPGGVSLYGGFAGWETTRSQREWMENETVLSGDLQGDDVGEAGADNASLLDNSFQIVRIVQPSATVRIDGFTISNGNALGGLLEVGAAIYVGGDESPEKRNGLELANSLITSNVSWAGNVFGEGARILVSNSTIRENVSIYGAGFYGLSGVASFQGVSFTSNAAGTGGAIYADLAHVELIRSTLFDNVAEAAPAISAHQSEDFGVWNCLVIGNRATSSGVGALSFQRTNAIVVNSVLSGNSHESNGGAMTVEDNSNVDVLNSVFMYNNSLGSGGAVYSNQSLVLIANSIFLENEAVSGNDIYSDSAPSVGVKYSIFSGGLPTQITDLGYNEVSDPRLVDPAGADGLPGTLDDNARLLVDSPAIDSGSNDALIPDYVDLDSDGNTIEDVPSDLADNIRSFSISRPATVDRGAFEFGAPAVWTGIESTDSTGPRLEVPFSLYPNPVRGSVRLRWDGDASAEANMDLFDVTGRRVRNISLGEVRTGTELELELDGIAPGVYFIRDSISLNTLSFVVIN